MLALHIPKPGLHSVLLHNARSYSWNQNHKYSVMVNLGIHYILFSHFMMDILIQIPKVDIFEYCVYPSISKAYQVISSVSDTLLLYASAFGMFGLTLCFRFILEGIKGHRGIGNPTIVYLVQCRCLACYINTMARDFSFLIIFWTLQNIHNWTHHHSTARKKLVDGFCDNCRLLNPFSSLCKNSHLTISSWTTRIIRMTLFMYRVIQNSV